MPLLIIVIAIAVLVFGQDAAQGEIVAQLHGWVGKESATAIETTIDRTFPQVYSRGDRHPHW